ncbi:MAG: hypothetical protein ACTSVA_04605 [Candidatus Njordarchaeales archaeon]
MSVEEGSTNDNALEKLSKALLFLEKLLEQIDLMKADVEDLRRFSQEMTAMLIEDIEEIKERIRSVAKKLVELEKKLTG